MDERATKALEKISSTIGECLATNDGEASFADAIEDLAKSIYYATKRLGTGDASTPMGALEMHGAAILDGAQTVAEAINNLAEAIRDH